MTWKEFFLEDVTDIKNGVRLTKSDMVEGDMPFIGATDSNNGVTSFISNQNDSKDYNVLGVNYNGSVGYSFYHPYESIFSDDVKRIKWKNEIKNNRYTLLFLSSIIDKQKDKYAYGYKFNGQRMRRQKVLLPVDSNNEIDWEYMENYMRTIENKILKETITILCKRLIINDIQLGGGNLYPRWKEFYFTEVFTNIKRGKRLTKANQEEGLIPYISSTGFNNGVDAFIGNKSGVRTFDFCLTLTNSGSVGNAFFHQYKFIASDHVTSLKRNGLDKYAYLFMIPIINRLADKYSFNREINDERINREKLLLPVKEDGEIDFEFMTSFMKRLEHNMLKTIKEFYQKRLTGKPLITNNIHRGGGKME